MTDELNERLADKDIPAALIGIVLGAIIATPIILLMIIYQLTEIIRLLSGSR
jgi:hypothetical protein